MVHSLLALHVLMVRVHFFLTRFWMGMGRGLAISLVLKSVASTTLVGLSLRPFALLVSLFGCLVSWLWLLVLVVLLY